MSAISEIRESDSLRTMRVPLRDHATQDVLDTRSRGAEARWSIEGELAAASQSEALVLDFAGVRAVTVSFADECIGKLLAGRAGGYHEEHPVLAVNANDDVRETLDITLSRGRMALLHASDPPQLLGADDILNDTLRAAWILRQFTAAQLASELGISAQAANNRLKALVQMSALRRALIIPPGGGKEFAYTVPEVGSPAAPVRKRAKRSGNGSEVRKVVRR